VQTHADFRIGTLVRWHGDDDDGADVDDLGIVVKMPGADWHGNYHIAWSITDTVSHHSPDMIEESLYQGHLEIVW
tara:strand:+ start:314 stop:538 length:225 start_codon:yes stop_codon:yes gene_type:complete